MLAADSPPRLRDLEPLLVQVVYMAWALGGLIFTVILMVIGFRYMTSFGDQQKQQDLKNRGKNWIIGLIIFFIGYPIIVSIYGVIGIGEVNQDCYQDIVTPGFHFFFPEICTDPQASGDKYALGSPSCNAFNDDEKQILVNSNRCCDGFYNIILNDRMLLNTSGNVVDIIESNQGICSVSRNCTANQTDCKPEYTVTGSPGSYVLKKND